jgi:hypothetical protein
MVPAAAAWMSWVRVVAFRLVPVRMSAAVTVAAALVVDFVVSVQLTPLTG